MIYTSERRRGTDCSAARCVLSTIANSTCFVGSESGVLPKIHQLYMRRAQAILQRDNSLSFLNLVVSNRSICKQEWNQGWHSSVYRNKRHGSVDFPASPASDSQRDEKRLLAMVFLEILRQMFRTLWAHKLRSFLTMFGIAWGVGSLLLLVGLGEGFRSGNQREMNSLGEDIMFVFPGRAPAIAGNMSSGAAITSRTTTIATFCRKRHIFARPRP